MKISICDICFYQDGEQVEATHRVGHTHSLKIDTCEKHKNIVKDKTPEQFLNWFADLRYS